jgi:glycerol-3-phosphate acyltransferase PlsX
VPGTEGPASHLPALRLLQRAAGESRRRRIGIRTLQIRIAVDAMGGDHAPSVIVDGAVAAARHLSAEILLVGPTADVERALGAYPDWRSLGIRVVEAPDVIGMAEPPTAALRRKPRSSVRVAADLVASREAVALVSAGHTGAAVLSAHAAFGMVAGVDRPALATTIPTRARPAVLLDAGANVECRPPHLLQFAVMGTVYARLVHGVESPRVGLLSIGEEETKGNELTREAHRLLKASPLHFIGNVEGREIYSGIADVVVCDGFTGNIVLKTSEGLVETVEALLGEELKGTFSSQVGYLLSKRAFRRFRRRVDYSEYGGAALLGVAGLVVVGHGRSSARAVRNAVAMAYRLATSDFISRVEQGIGQATAVRH